MPAKDFLDRWKQFFTPQNRRRLRQGVGLVLILLLVWQLSRGEQLPDWWTQLQISWGNGNAWKYLLPALLLMPVNWTLEALKWQQLLGAKSGWSWAEIWTSVLAGISVSLATPNRIGEYGGRAMVAPAERAVGIIWTSILGSLCQWTAFLICGWPALCFWLSQWYQWPTLLSWGVASLVPVALFTIWLLLFRVGLRSWLTKILKRNKWWRWLQSRLSDLATISPTAALRALLLALFRFVVYTFQFLLLLWFFGAPLGFGEGMSGIFSIYLIQVGIPLPPGLSVISRSEIAVLFWGGSSINPVAIISATFSVYLINLLLPALLGTWIIVRKNNNGD